VRSSRQCHPHVPPSLHRSGDYRAAAAAYTAGIRHAPSAALLANRAAAVLQLGDARDALRDCRAALRLEPRHVKSRVRAARALQVRPCGQRVSACWRSCPDALRLAPSV
jgi:hypothetical protein